MRTTISLPDALLVEARTYAARTGRSLNRFVEDAVRAALARGQEPARDDRPVLPSFAGGPLQPGVDLDDSAALLDLMEGPGH